VGQGDMTASSKPAKTKRAKRPPLVIGWREEISLPDLGLTNIRAKIDTGARTTALHASHIRTYQRDGALWVQFHPSTHRGLPDIDLCHAPVHDRRQIKNTSGIPEERIVIRTHLHIADRKYLIDVSLTDRADMAYPIIIGRTAIRNHSLLVNSGRSWLTRPTPPRGAKTSKE
jgi:hypothetical protein